MVTDEPEPGSPEYDAQTDAFLVAVGAIPAAAHVLHYTPDCEGFGSWRLECTDICPRECWEERDWPDQNTCRCTEEGNDCESCREGDHGGCGFFGGYSNVVGYECRAKILTGECWLQSHFDSIGAEMIGDGPWVEDGPWPVDVDGDDEAPVLIPAKVAVP